MLRMLRSGSGTLSPFTSNTSHVRLQYYFPLSEPLGGMAEIDPKQNKLPSGTTLAASNILSSGEPKEARLCTRIGRRRT
jgi:hypothetical protein